MKARLAMLRAKKQKKTTVKRKELHDILPPASSITHPLARAACCVRVCQHLRASLTVTRRWCSCWSCSCCRAAHYKKRLEEKEKSYESDHKKQRRRKKQPAKEEEEEAEAEAEEGIDPEMAAMMGFSGFSSKKKN